MPKLSFPELTQGYARFILIALYRSHPPFAKELEEVKKPYIEAMNKYAKDTKASIREKPQSNTEYFQMMTKCHNWESEDSPFTAEQKKDICRLTPYFDELIKLVDKWIFKAIWAVGTLFHFDMIQFVEVEPSKKQGISLEIFEPMVPWSPPLAPLKIEVSAWTFFEHSRDEIISEIADRHRLHQGNHPV